MVGEKAKFPGEIAGKHKFIENIAKNIKVFKSFSCMKHKGNIRGNGTMLFLTLLFPFL